jgi:ABC-type nickel/cobalt efflux system permease component RcnA
MLIATLNGKKLPLKLEKVEFPTDLREMQAGATYPVLTLSAAWPQGTTNETKLYFSNRLDEKNSLNWFGVSALDPTAFHTPLQNASNLEIDVVRNRNLLLETSSLLASWDSNTPVLQTNAAQSQTTASSGSTTPSAQEILTGLVKQEQFSLSFYFLALGVSLVLGALHALTPGHGKTVVAAYLVGARGTTWHAIALGSIVTLTHTGSVLLLGFVTLVASRYILPTSIIPALEVLSGLLIVSLGVYLLAQRLREWRHSQMHLQGHVHYHSPDHNHDHEHGHRHHHHDSDHDHEHDHGHSHTIPDALTWRSLTALGISGGLVPCPDAIAILLVAIAINRILFGLTLIISFSLGLAVVLIAIGLVMVHSRRVFDRLEVFSRFAPAMPVISAVVVMILGLGLTYSASAQLMGEFNLVAVSNPLEKAHVVYLADDSNKHKQIFLADLSGKNPHMITSVPLGIVDYALSPDRNQLVYFSQTENSDNDIWLTNLDGTQNRQVAACKDALCRNPVWSPDGQRVVYESINLRDRNSLVGIPTLWWLDVASGETKPVFQKADLPVLNPRWSPDGQWLSYATPEGIHLYHLETGESRLIGNRIGSAAGWASNSQSLILRDSVENGNELVTQLFRYDLASQQLTPFNPDLTMENLLVEISPTGDWVAVVRRETVHLNENQIWLVRIDGSATRQLTNVENGIYSSLSWSPDGKYLLCDVYQTNSAPLETHLQLIEIQTGIVHDIGSGYSPSWVWNELPSVTNAQ